MPLLDDGSKKAKGEDLEVEDEEALSGHKDDEDPLEDDGGVGEEEKSTYPGHTHQHSEAY